MCYVNEERLYQGLDNLTIDDVYYRQNRCRRRYDSEQFYR